MSADLYSNNIYLLQEKSASVVMSGLFTMKPNLYKRGTHKSGFALPPQEGAVSVVTGSISFRVGRVFLRARYYSIETESGALSERVFIFFRERYRMLPGRFSQMEAEWVAESPYLHF